MEKKAPDALEMAAQKDEEREKAEKAAQGWVNNSLIELEKFIYYYIITTIKWLN